MRVDLVHSLRDFPKPFYDCVEIIFSQKGLEFKSEISIKGSLIDENLISDLREAISEMEAHNDAIKAYNKAKKDNYLNH